MNVRPAQLAVAAACAAWQVGFLVDNGVAALVVPPVCLLGLLAMPARPAFGGVLLIGSALLSPAFGVSTEDPAGLLSWLAAMYGMGRYGSALHALWFIPGFALASSLTADPFPITVAFAHILSAGVWLFGHIVKRRAAQGKNAVAELIALESTDPAVVAHRVVQEERSRLRSDITAVVRRAVVAMHADAVAAQDGLDPARLAAVQDKGAAVVADLRRLLGLLRDDPGPAPLVRVSRRSPLLVDAVTAAGVAVLLVVVDPGIPGAEPMTLPLLILSIAAASTLGWRRTNAVWASVAAAVVMLAAAMIESPLYDGFGMLALLCLMAWSLGARPSAMAAGAATALVSGVVAQWRDSDVLFTLVLLGVGAFAGHEWGERDRALDHARRTVDALQDAHDAVVARAVSEEHLRIARDLHDVTSHAVGVMVLQAGAANAQRTRDPAAARAAVRAIREAGAQALAELTTLLDVFDASRPTSHDPPSLAALVDRMRAAGLNLVLEEGAPPTADDVAQTVYRIVQEALTNVVRHAPSATTAVRTRRCNDTFVVEIRNGPSSSPTMTAGPSGFGLVGLAERVRSLGGEFTAGPSDGDFVVRAVMPDRVKEST